MAGLLECVCGRRIRSDGTFADGRHRKLHPEPCEAWGRRARLADETWEPAILGQLSSIALDDATIGAVVAALGSTRRPVAIGRGHVERQLRDLALQHAARAIGDEAYLARVAELGSVADRLDAAEGTGVTPARAVAWLRVIGQTMEPADLPAELADLVHAVYERIIVAGPRFVSARLTPAANDHGLALALPEKVVMARPTGVGRTVAT